MPRLPGTTNAQTSFLRSLRDQTGNHLPTDWPSAVVMRRWLRRPGFRAAIQSIQNALAVQADLQLSAAAAEAAAKLRDVVAPNTTQSGDDQPESDPTPTHDVAGLLRILRSAHLRQRFVRSAAAEQPDAAPPAIPIERIVEQAAKLDPRRYHDMLQILKELKPDQPVSDAIRQIEDWIVGRGYRTRN
ncbi:MAG TPA: hypothetical protein PLD59_09390 [Tepidisphaeraceae bacterium]|nr:hypothetical protein [Tepidisphaeraceae bacterium]